MRASSTPKNSGLSFNARSYSASASSTSRHSWSGWRPDVAVRAERDRAARKPPRKAKDKEQELREDIAKAAALHVFTRLGVTDPADIDLDAAEITAAAV